MIDRFQAFVAGVTTCYRAIQRIKTMEMTEFGLRGSHVMCLFFLHHHPDGLTAAQLCQLCGEDKAAISRGLVVLRDRGYIGAEGKKYRAILRLTEAGEAIARQIDVLISRWVASGGDGLSDGEREVFYRALDRIAANLREHVEASDANEQ